MNTAASVDHSPDGHYSARLTAAVGGAAVVAFLAGIVAGPTKLISTNSSAATIANDVAQSPTRAAASGAVVVLGSTLLVAFVVLLGHTVRQRGHEGPLPGLLLGAGLFIAVGAALDNIVLGALVFAGRQSSLGQEPAFTKSLWHLYNGLLMPGLVGFGIAMYLAAIAGAALTGYLRPRWLGWVSLVFVPLALVSGFVGMTASNGGMSPAAPLGLGGFLIATIITTVTVARPERRRERSVRRSRIPA